MINFITRLTPVMVMLLSLAARQDIRTKWMGGAAREGKTVQDDAGDGSDFRRGWDAAILAVSHWHASKAKQTMVQARRARFPKTLEAEAALHERCADAVKILSPDDV